MSVRQQTGSARRAIALFGLFCFVLTTAILPAGHMATQLASGSAFTFCPSDAGSATWIKLLGQDSGAADQHHGLGAHHHGDPTVNADAGVPHAGTSHGTHNAASPECELAAAAAAVAFAVSNDPIGFKTRSNFLAPPLGQPLYKRRHWLRPPVRSPTA